MKKSLLFAALLAVAVVAQAGNGGRRFTVPLTGAEEFPGPGDPDGTGLAVLKLNPGTQQVCFQILVSDITLPATLAHIHEAPAGSS